MSKERITGRDFCGMIRAAYARLEQNRQEINELNVFPVPDGDTGTNMSLTVQAFIQSAKGLGPDITVGAAAEAVASAMLRGARGNSGVILSLLWRGFARRLRDWKDIDGADFALAMGDGVQTAYQSVMKPAEGTILTVSRVAAEKGAEASGENTDVSFVLERMAEAADRAVEETVHQNPVLEKAGVVDAGGYGYALMLGGMLAYLRGEETGDLPEGIPAESHTSARFSEYATEDIKFSYCTEFIVEREGKKRDPMRLRAFLESMGDSLVFVDDEEIIKVHVHTNHPGKVLEEALKYGPLSPIKIENMKNQHTQILTQEQETASAAAQRTVAPPERKYGFVSVCAGEGLCAVFRDLGADRLIEGGQTMNPSTQDILAAIDGTPAEIVFVLPNNKNIIMAAEQCAPLSDKRVVVIPTKSVPQGIAALIAFDPSLGEEENREAMYAAISRVQTGQVTYAAHEREFDGHKIRKGDYLALADGKLVTTHKEQMTALRRLAREMGGKDASFVTVFAGEGVGMEEAEQVRELFAAECKNAEVSLLSGGQPVYYYLVSVE